MIVAGSASPLLLSSAGGYNLTNSLRFRASAQSYLNRTFGTPTNNKIWTYSVWIKRGSLAANRTIMSSNVDGAEYWDMRFNTSDQILIQNRVGSSNLLLANTTAVYRDPSAWYHIVFVFDSNNATAANRNLLYVNGVNVTLSANSGSSDASAWNVNSVQHNIGVSRTLNPSGGIWAEYDGYEAEINFIDGQALTPSSFGQTSATTGVWIPKKYSGTYGTNGFYLPFTDNSALTTSSNVGLGKDFSGNANYWTTNNISITSGSTYDSMTDVPTLTSATAANYAVWNPLWKLGGSGYITPTNGNLRASIGGTYNIIASTIPLPSTGKWYMEFTLTTGVYAEYGLCSATASGGGTNAGVFAAYYNGAAQYALINGSFALTDGNQAWVSGDIGLIAVDVDNNKVWLGRNRSGTVVWMGGGNPSAGTSPSFSAAGGGGVYSTAFNAQTFNNPFVASGGGSDVWDANFGQQPFVGTPPTNFNRLNTFNLPTPTIGATASTTANKYFDATTYTGTGSTQSIVNSGAMQPDLVWLKSRSNAQDHNLYDSVRGISGTGSPVLFPNLTDAETTYTGFGVSALNSNGFTVIGNGGLSNSNGFTYVGWQWRASNATAVTNTAGSITSTVSANTTAGFSIVTYTGTGANATVGHGLGVAPSMVIVKRRPTAGSNWPVWHTGIANTEYLMLNSSNAKTTGLAWWNSTSPTSTVFSVGSDPDTNGTVAIVAYCFAPIAGYSAFGSYTGNGSTDGPFIYTGFRPSFILVKRTDSTGNWCLFDDKRLGYNGTSASKELYPNLSLAEGSSNGPDQLSNGFKFRDTYSDVNGSGATYIYMAFAESPFKYANAR
jgi:hypothetical protein